MLALEPFDEKTVPTSPEKIHEDKSKRGCPFGDLHSLALVRDKGLALAVIQEPDNLSRLPAVVSRNLCVDEPARRCGCRVDGSKVLLANPERFLVHAFRATSLNVADVKASWTAQGQ